VRDTATVASYLRHLEVERRMAANTLEAYVATSPAVAFAAAARSRRDAVATDLEAASRASMAKAIRRVHGAARGGRARVLSLPAHGGRIAQNPADDSSRRATFSALPRFLASRTSTRCSRARCHDAARPARSRADRSAVRHGLRVSELVGSGHRCRVDEGYVQCLGKGSKERIVPLATRRAHWVRRYLRKRDRACPRPRSPRVCS
jgi:integrase/recombinase XerD